MKFNRNLVVLFLVIYLCPALASAGYWYVKERPGSWREADWSSTGILPHAEDAPDAAISSPRVGCSINRRSISARPLSMAARSSIVPA